MVGDNIKAARERAGLSQTELARRLGIRQPSVCAWEAGKTFPSYPKLIELCAILRVTADELLRGGAAT